MPGIERQLTLDTLHGPATYVLAMDERLQVSVHKLPFAGLPDTVYKMTYGEGWQRVKTYFDRVGRTLPYRLRANLAHRRPSSEFEELTTAYHDQFRGASGDAFTDFWARHGKQLNVFSLDEKRMNSALDALRQRGQRRAIDDFGPFLQPYLERLLPIASYQTSVLIYAVFKELKTEAAREFLIGELESEGRHPYTLRILHALDNYADRPMLNRLIQVYRDDKIAYEDLTDYIMTMIHYPYRWVGDHLVELLQRHPSLALEIGAAMQSSGASEKAIATALREQYDRQEDYYPIDELVNATHELTAEEYRIDLATHNRKLSHERYTDLPPVNWPQQLERGWRKLIDASPTDEVLQVVEQGLSSDTPRLQRNALLQLKYFLSESERVSVPKSIERHLRDAIGARYDKVYVEALNILGDRKLDLADAGAMLDAILAVSIGSRYKVVVLTALRQVGDSDKLRERAFRYYARKIGEVKGEEEHERIASLLPYVDKYLGGDGRLQKLLYRTEGRASG